MSQKPPKREKEPLLSPKFPCPNPMPDGEGSSGGDAALDWAEILSREEVLRRRSHRAKQLARVYRRHYWALVEEIRVKHRDYYWEFGKSPLEEEEAAAEAAERQKCGFAGCKSKAMPLTKFCHQHICHDRKQTLYKPCSFVTKSGQNLIIKCQKPVLRATTPCLCPVHFQKIQKQNFQALKKAGITYPNKAPKFHILIAECVRQIQARRKKALNASKNADEPSVSSLNTTDWTELDVISKNVAWLVENNSLLYKSCNQNVSSSDVDSCCLQESNIEGMMGSNEAQRACSMTTVRHVLDIQDVLIKNLFRTLHQLV